MFILMLFSLIVLLIVSLLMIFASIITKKIFMGREKTLPLNVCLTLNHLHVYHFLYIFF